MDNFWRQDIFFFVTTVSIVVLTILVGVAVVYVVLILKKINYISGKTKTEVDLFAQELATLRSSIKSTGFKFAHLINFVSNIKKGSKKK